MSRRVFLLVGLLCLLTPLASADFAVYYGGIGPSEYSRMDDFDVIILSPTVDDNYVSRLSSGHRVLGYISLATIGGWEPWAKDVPKALIIGRNDNWNEKVVDFSSPEWKRIILDEAIPYILSRGFNGIFLDNLDYVELYPDKKEAMVDLVRAIRRRYPGVTIAVNRGFSIIEEVAPYVDYVLFEDFVTHYNFSSGRYEVFDEDDLRWEFNQIERLESLGVPVLALSYANLSDESQAREFSKLVCKYAEEYNVSGVYLTDLSLQRMGLNPCAQKMPGEAAGETPSRTSGKENKICGPAVFLPLALLGPLISRWRLS